MSRLHSSFDVLQSFLTAKVPKKAVLLFSNVFGIQLMVANDQNKLSIPTHIILNIADIRDVVDVPKSKKVAWYPPAIYRYLKL